MYNKYRHTKTIGLFYKRKLLYVITKEKSSIIIHIYQGLNPEEYDFVQWTPYNSRVIQHQTFPMEELDRTIKSFKYNSYQIMVQKTELV